MEKRLIQEILDTAKGKNLLWFHVVWDWSEALNHPAMCDYYTSKVWPNLIRVYLKLCPILFWERKDQQIRPVFSNAREGQWMTAKIDKDGVIVNFWSKLSEEDIYQIRSQLLPIWRSEQEPIKKFVSLINSIEVDSQNQIQVTLSNQIRVLLGDEVSPKKVQRVTRVLNWIKQKNLEMCVIDAQQDEKFLVRLRNHF